MRGSKNASDPPALLLTVHRKTPLRVRNWGFAASSFSSSRSRVGFSAATSASEFQTKSGLPLPDDPDKRMRSWSPKVLRNFPHVAAIYCNSILSGPLRWSVRPTFTGAELPIVSTLFRTGDQFSSMHMPTQAARLRASWSCP